MTGKQDPSGTGAGGFRFRVSDALEVPLRGMLLRLRLLDGAPSMKDLAPGRKMRIGSAAGTERLVTIVGHSSTGGRATQDRLERTRELDVVIPKQEAGQGAERVDIGWHVTGPVR